MTRVLCHSLFVVVASVIWPGTAYSARGELELRAVDEAGEPTAVRIQIENSRGRSVFAPRMVRSGGGFVFDGTIVLNLPPDTYTFRAEKGPEFRDREGHFQIQSGATDNHRIEMRRFVDMQAEGWWSGDLLTEFRPPQMPVIMLAEDLHLANVVTWDSERRGGAWPADAIARRVGHSRVFHLTGGREQRAGSDVVFGRASEPLELTPSQGEFPSPFESLKDRRLTKGMHVHLNRIDCWDLPVWIASGRLHSVGVLHPGLRPDGSDDHAVARPRDRVLFPDPDGVGRWAQHIYFRLLESGIRMTPAASSGSAPGLSPLGYNRVYVHCGKQFSPDAWWQGLRLGRVLLTNGPLLRPRVNGQLPGHRFKATTGDKLQLEVEAQLGTRQKIDYLEIIKNGRPEVQVRLDEWAARGGRLPAVTFDASGWMMVRAVARDAKAYRCVCSGPYYVEFDSRPRVSRKASQFFLDWVYERAGAIEVADAERRDAVLRYHRAARDFWQARVDMATTD